MLILPLPISLSFPSPSSGQSQLLADTGASVTTKGTWLPDKSKATAADPPLYLHVVATSKEILDKALAAVRALFLICVSCAGPDE